MDSRRQWPWIVAAIIGSLPLLTIPFAPLPFPPGLSWGGGELFSRGYEAIWSGKLPRPGEFTLFARARSAAAAPSMQRLSERSPRLVSLLALLSVAANLSLAAFNIYRDFGIGAPYLLQ